MSNPLDNTVYRDTAAFIASLFPILKGDCKNEVLGQMRLLAYQTNLAIQDIQKGYAAFASGATPNLDKVEYAINRTAAYLAHFNTLHKHYTQQGYDIPIKVEWAA